MKPAITHFGHIFTSPNRVPHRPFHIVPEGYDFAVAHAEWTYQGIIESIPLRDAIPTAYLRVASGSRVVGLPTVFLHKRLCEWFADDVVAGYFQAMQDLTGTATVLHNPLLESFEQGEFMSVSRGWDTPTGDYYAIPLTSTAVPFPGVSHMALAPECTLLQFEEFMASGDPSGLPKIQ